MLQGFLLISAVPRLQDATGHCGPNLLLWVSESCEIWGSRSGLPEGLFFVVYFLVFSVCDGSLGLSILVSIIRSHGNDYFKSYIVLQCYGFFIFLFF